MMKLTEKEWIDKYPADYKKICGTMHITKLEYRFIMQSLSENNLYNLVKKLIERKNSLYENNDCFYKEMELLHGHPIKH